MRKIHSVLALLLFIIPGFIQATTWNEPWADKVIRESNSFVLAKVISSDEHEGIQIKILKQLAGEQLPEELKINDFKYVAVYKDKDVHGPEFHFENIDSCYFFIAKDSKGGYCFSTPTSGFDRVKDGQVFATYRHSYHQALVPVAIYEMTMTAIFNNYHQKEYDQKDINSFVKEQLSHKPAGFQESEINTFFKQHVALECVYHLKLEGYYNYILPFLNDTANFHNQVSAARALVAYNTPECKKELVSVISDTKRDIFLQVICIWTLKEFKPTELKAELKKILPTASEANNGFGGNIMDPRVGTHFPEVKDALKDLIETL